MKSKPRDVRRRDDDAIPAGRWIDLLCHPQSAGVAALAITARASRPTLEALAFGFRLRADLAGILVPPPRPPRIASELWRHTCFEAFVAADGAALYHELNFSPSGDWAAHAFRGYRDGGPLADDTHAPRISVLGQADRLELDAFVAIDALPGIDRSRALRIGLSAVIESSDGALSYWALRHPAARPDFHHPEGFALRLEAPAVGC